MTATTNPKAKEVFLREHFSFHGGYLCYHADATVYESGPCCDCRSSRFVARFKYNKSRKGRFLTFLIKNFTPEEYFERLEKNGESPLEILESKGFDPLSKKQRAELEAQLASL